MRELGGIFTLPELSNNELSLKPNVFTDVLTDNGRSAFRLILKEIIKEKNSVSILLPEYICEDAFYPAITAVGGQYKHYTVNAQLMPELDQNLLSNADAIVLVSYFGFTDVVETAQELKKNNPQLEIILDYSQNLEAYVQMETIPDWVDFVFCSYRKFLPIISGGGFKSKKSIDVSLPNINQINSNNWIESLYLASVVKEKIQSASTVDSAALLHEFSLHFDSYRKRLEQATEPSSIDERSFQVLQKISFRDVFRARNENYRYLKSLLKDSTQVRPLFSTAPANAPLFFPVYVTGNRNSLVKKLREHGIFCPIHWPLDLKRADLLSLAAKKIYGQGLSLLIDQRMTSQDLDRLADLIK